MHQSISKDVLVEALILMLVFLNTAILECLKFQSLWFMLSFFLVLNLILLRMGGIKTDKFFKILCNFKYYDFFY